MQLCVWHSLQWFGKSAFNSTRLFLIKSNCFCGILPMTKRFFKISIEAISLKHSLFLWSKYMHIIIAIANKQSPKQKLTSTKAISLIDNPNLSQYMPRVSSAMQIVENRNIMTNSKMRFFMIALPFSLIIKLFDLLEIV